MKTKLILGALLGATICVSAFADVSVDNRRAFCEQADGFVWVEKTQACIPINPCLLDGNNIKIRDAYCFELGGFDEDTIKMILERSAREVLHSGVSEIKKLDNKNYENKAEFYSLKTTGGDYLVVENFTIVGKADAKDCVYAALWAYGSASGMFYNNLDTSKVGTQTKCEDVADFATLLYDSKIKHNWIPSSMICQFTTENGELIK